MMRASPGFNAESHAAMLSLAVAQLLELSPQLADPAPIAEQFVGTVVDNTLGALTSALASLTGERTVVEFSDAANWIQYMASVHRSFFASLLMSVEGGLAALCADRGLKVEASRARTAEAIISRLDPISKKEANAIRLLAGSHPQFMDYVDMAARQLPTSNRSAFWRRYFKALAIVRNKASHYDPQLRQSEVQALSAGGLAHLVRGDQLSLNAGMYRAICETVLEFYRELSSDGSGTGGQT